MRKKRKKMQIVGNEGCNGISSPFPKPGGNSANLNGASDVLTVKEGRIFLNSLPRSLYACLRRTEHNVPFKARSSFNTKELKLTSYTLQ